MARPKDRHLLKDEINGNNKRIYNAGGYGRISVNKGNENKSSLNAQKLMIKTYIQEHEDIELIQYYEDDGISGMHFERDNFTKMLNDIRDGVIDTVIVKDFSRFGRNLEEVSIYLERIFPFMGVRFIAINDNYDSADPRCDEDMLRMMIMNLANDLYTKDLSKKAYTRQEIIRKSGGYLGKYAPYGYRRVRTSDGRNITEIDPSTAPYVVEIFNKVIAGETYVSIADSLGKRHINIPKVYNETGCVFSKSRTFWYLPTIKNILMNRHYLGDTYSHKTATLNHNKVRVRLSEDEWYVCKGTHEAIIDVDTFQKAQDEVKRRTEKWKSRITNPNIQKDNNKYLKILKCGKCKKTMTMKRTRIYAKTDTKQKKYTNYHCRTYVETSGEVCDYNFWLESVLDELVLNAIKLQIKRMSYLQRELYVFYEKHYNSVLRTLNRARSQEECKRKKLDVELIKLYEQFVLKNINQVHYKETVFENKQKIKCCEEKIQEINFFNTYILDLKKENWIWIEKFLLAEFDSLTEEIVRLYVKEIFLYSDKQLEIVFHYEDELKKLEDELKEMKKYVEMRSIIS